MKIDEVTVVMKVDEVTVEVSPTSSYSNHCVKVKNGRKRYSLIYLTKPKAISQKSFDAAMEVIEVTLPPDFEFELEPEKELKKKVKVTGK